MEARGIKVEDIDFKNKSIILKKVKRKTNFSDGRFRTILISTEFCQYLKKIILEYGLISKNNLPILSGGAANTSMKKALLKSGIKDWDMFSVHTIRKSTESWLVSLEISSLKILKHFGHNQNTALKHYIQLIYENPQERFLIREIIGDLYSGDDIINILKERIINLENKMKRLKAIKAEDFKILITKKLN